jgi:hypothetical protein
MKNSGSTDKLILVVPLNNCATLAINSTVNQDKLLVKTSQFLVMNNYKMVE